MSIKYLLKFIPDRDKISQIESLKFLGDKLHRPNLWLFNQRAVSRAMAAGMWAMYTPPLPWQMMIAATLAVYFDANLPIAVALVWITNPFTWIPLYYLAYWLGTEIMGVPHFNFDQFSSIFSLDTAWDLGAPLLVGCFALMNGGALLGYFLTRYLWRRQVANRWRARQYWRTPPTLADMTRMTCREYQVYLDHVEAMKKKHSLQDASSPLS